MSQGEKRVLLPAGAEGFPVRAQGDFIFVRACSFPIRVIVDGQPITMEAGEKRVFKRKNPLEMAFSDFQVDNLSTVAQQVTFITGEGDFEKIIVSGELNVSAYVNTAGNGQAKSLPFGITKTIGVDSLAVVEDVAQTLIYTSHSTITTGAQAVFWFDGFFYALDSTHLHKFNALTTTGTVDAEIALGDGAANIAAIWPRGAAARSDGRVFFHGGGKLFSLSMGDYSVKTELVTFGVDDFKNPMPGGAMILDRYYYAYCRVDDNSNGDDDYFLVYDTYTEQVTTKNISGLGTLFPNGGMASLDGKIVTASNGNSNWMVIDVSGDVGIYEGFHPTLKMSTVARAFSADGRYGAYTSGDLCAIRTAQNRTFYGALYVQDGSDTATRKIVNLDSAPDYFARGAGHVLNISPADLVLKAYGYNVENYLDYVTEVSASDGYIYKTVGSGTQTFALRGLSDLMPVFMESEVSFKILPEFFE